LKGGVSHEKRVYGIFLKGRKFLPLAALTLVFIASCGGGDSGGYIYLPPAPKIYVVDAGNNRIVRMDDMTRAGWTTLGSSGSGINQFANPSDIFVR
jgi:predicted small lipoprotein YifL